MEVLLITADGARRRSPDELDTLLADVSAGRGVVWVDVPAWDDAAAEVLTGRFGIHPRAAGDCAKRNPVPKVHVYRDHLFVVLHSPERGARGHVHYVELDQFIGPGWYITVHGPLNPKVAPRRRGSRRAPSPAASSTAASAPRPRTSCRSPSSRR